MFETFQLIEVNFPFFETVIFCYYIIVQLVDFKKSYSNKLIVQCPLYIDIIYEKLEAILFNDYRDNIFAA